MPEYEKRVGITDRKSIDKLVYVALHPTSVR